MELCLRVYTAGCPVAVLTLFMLFSMEIAILTHVV